jgi:2-keto-4-pentenoate hydratase/2-oxohepta-3-ene-1,7-dioic acid hydratase in catechol pathway
VGRNYKLHAVELGNEVPTAPMIFSKPTHSLALANGQPIAIAADGGEIHYEAEFVLHIGRSYEAGMTVEDLVDKFALGIDLTKRNVQSELKKKGHPWLLAKGFRNSAIITAFRDFPGTEACGRTDFALLKNGQQVQLGNIRDVIFDFQTLIDFIAAHFGLGAGDVIFTGTPEGVGPVTDGDRFALLWGDETLGDFVLSLS